MRRRWWSIGAYILRPAWSAEYFYAQPREVESNKKWLADFLDRYEMADRRMSEAVPFGLNEVRGKLFKVPRAKYVEDEGGTRDCTHRLGA